jgi:uncharacterized protein YbjT (DUF2867 family)
VAQMPRMRTQLVGARTVAQALVSLATGPEAADTPILEIAGPREESLAGAAELLVARRGDRLKVEEVAYADDPDMVEWAEGALLPGPDAVLAGPTFEEWLDGESGSTKRPIGSTLTV